MTQYPIGPGHPRWDEVPDEIKEVILAENARQEIAAADYRHSIIRLISESDYDNLITLRNLLHNMTWAARPDIFSAYYESQVASELQTRFNICSACGVDHDKEVAMEHPSSQPGNSPKPADQPIEELKDAGKTFVNIYGDLTEEDIRHMQMYDLDDLRSDGTFPDAVGGSVPEGTLVGFICTRCRQMSWPSIADRMLDPVDKCDGCYKKAAHG